MGEGIRRLYKNPFRLIISLPQDIKRSSPQILEGSLRVSKKSTLSWTRIPFARKSKIFGLHSLLLRYPKKIYALSAYFFRPRRHNKLFYSATGGNRLLSSANTTPVPLKTRLLSGFSLTRSFFDAPVAGKTKSGSSPLKN